MSFSVAQIDDMRLKCEEHLKLLGLSFTLRAMLFVTLVNICSLNTIESPLFEASNQLFIWMCVFCDTFKFRNQLIALVFYGCDNSLRIIQYFLDFIIVFASLNKVTTTNSYRIDSQMNFSKWHEINLN